MELTRSFFQGEDFGLGSDINPGHLTNGVLLELSNEFAGNLYDTVSILWPHLFTPQQLKRTVGKVRTIYTQLHKNSHHNNKSVLFLQDRLFSEADVTEAIAQVTKKTVKENKVFVQQEKVIKELGKKCEETEKDNFELNERVNVLVQSGREKSCKIALLEREVVSLEKSVDVFTIYTLFLLFHIIFVYGRCKKRYNTIREKHTIITQILVKFREIRQFHNLSIMQIFGV